MALLPFPPSSEFTSRAGAIASEAPTAAVSLTIGKAMVPRSRRRSESDNTLAGTGAPSGFDVVSGTCFDPSVPCTTMGEVVLGRSKGLSVTKALAEIFKSANSTS